MPIGTGGVHVRAVFEFSKYSGAGNDFVIARADDRSDPIGAELARRVCSRRTGVGVDGLILVYLRPDGIRVRFFNPDGSEFSTCGNGSRCAARFASDEGLGDPAGFVLETPAGEIDARVDGDRVALDYHIDVSLQGPMEVAGPTGPVESWLVQIGVPHLVVPLGRIPDGPIDDFCKPLRRLKALGPAGANVNLVSLSDTSSGAVRTFERGVEAETLACGSGSMASVFALRATGKAEPQVSLRVSSGETLDIEILDLAPPDGTVRDVRLSGPAVKLFEGTFHETILAP